MTPRLALSLLAFAASAAPLAGQAEETRVGAPAGTSAEQDPTTEPAPASPIAADMPAVTMPVACDGNTGTPPMDAVPEGLPAHGQAMLEGVLRVREPLVAGMGAADPDLAFACAMIAHHQAAISIANVGIGTGEDDALRTTAEEIVEGHRQQIETLTRWVTENAP